MLCKIISRPQVHRHIVAMHSFRKFSTSTPALSEYDSEVVDELMKTIDMTQLQQFNPKLHDQLAGSPEKILDLKELIMTNEAKGEMMASE